MIYNIYAIRDFKTGFLSPITEQSEVTAIRNFEYACSKDDNLMNHFPNDFSLYEIGSYDSDTGLLQAVPVIRLVASASDFVNKKESE